MSKGTRIAIRQTKTFHDNAETLPRYDGPIHDHWRTAARLKGYRVVDRVRDKDHLLLECDHCGKRHAKRHSVVLAAATLLCPHCQLARMKTLAARAGLLFLRRDPKDRAYAFLRAPCGHELRRQFSFLERVSRGDCGIRCEVCHGMREATEAEERGWILIGPDPKGNPSYRQYRHGGDCGHEQRVARANMQTGRFTCEACGDCWSAAPNNIYVMSFQVPKLGSVVKLGHARDPVSRLHHQLRPAPGVKSEIVRILPMASGHAALVAEQAMHAQIKARHPGAEVPSHLLRDWIRVGSEIYRQQVEPMIHRLLDDLEAELGS